MIDGAVIPWYLIVAAPVIALGGAVAGLFRRKKK